MKLTWVEPQGTASKINVSLDLMPSIQKISLKFLRINQTFSELNGYFSTSPNQNEVTLILQRPIAEEDIPDNRIVTIDIQAVSETTAHATIVLKVIRNEGSVEFLSFEQPYYSGSYKQSSGLIFDPIIRLESGFEDAINFSLEGGKYKSRPRLGDSCACCAGGSRFASEDKKCELLNYLQEKKQTQQCSMSHYRSTYNQIYEYINFLHTNIDR